MASHFELGMLFAPKVFVVCCRYLPHGQHAPQHGFPRILRNRRRRCLVAGGGGPVLRQLGDSQNEHLRSAVPSGDKVSGWQNVRPRASHSGKTDRTGRLPMWQLRGVGSRQGGKLDRLNLRQNMEALVKLARILRRVEQCSKLRRLAQEVCQALANEYISEQEILDLIHRAQRLRIFRCNGVSL